MAENKSKSAILDAIERKDFDLWLHPDQINGEVYGEDILGYLVNKDLCCYCASLDDLNEIQAQGIDFWRKHFDRKERRHLLAWRGLRPYMSGDDCLTGPKPMCFVYYLQLNERGDEVVLGSFNAYTRFTSNFPALRFGFKWREYRS